MRVVVRKFIICGTLAAVVWAAALFGGCDLIKEGITGEKPEDPAAIPVVEKPQSAPAAFPVIGAWYGVYGDREYLSIKLTADGRCELQPATYESDMFGPVYYGDYIWGGDDGRSILLDLYRGTAANTGQNQDSLHDVWYDGGRDGADTALQMAFEVIGGPDVKTFALKAASAGVDTAGYTVVHGGAFVVLLPHAPDGGGGGTVPQFLFGTEAGDPDTEKSKACKVPDTFTGAAERFYTTEDLNVRCGPGRDNATYGTVPKNTVVDKVGYMAAAPEDWVFVLLAEGGGWVNTGYLSQTAAEVPVAPEAAGTAE